MLSALTLVLGACGGGQFPWDTLPAANRKALQQVLNSVPADGVAPGAAVALHHPAYEPWASAAGKANLATGTALTPEHRMRGGSMLKTAVAVAVLQLVEQRKLSLADPLDRILPADIARQVPQAHTMTLRMLLNHTSGLPEAAGDDFDLLVLANPTRTWTLDDYLARARTLPREFEPGQGWAYSNTNYLLLGAVITQATGQPWRQVVQARVFARAGLADSALPNPGDTRCTGCARGYEWIGGRYVDTTEVDPSVAEAAGGSAWISAPADLNRLLRALFASRLFDQRDTLDTMLTLIPAPLPEEAREGYGLGLMKFSLDGVVYWGHLGGTAGYNSFMLIQPASGLTVGGYINTRGDLAALLVPVLQAVAQIPNRPN